MTLSAERISRIRQALERELAPTQLDIEDDSAAHAGHAGANGGGHFRLVIVANAFRGRSSIARHRLVYSALGPLMESDIHALNIIARTPEELT